MTNKAKILHIEDDPADAILTREMIIQALSAEIIHLRSGEEFYRAVAEGPFDVVLSDYSVPGYDCLEALAHVRTIDPDVPFLVLSGTLGEEAAVEMMKRGINDYILKDKPARLAEAIRISILSAEQARHLRRTIAALHRNEANLAAAQAIAKLGSWEYDPASRVGTWSAQMFRLFERDPALGVPELDELLTLVHPDDGLILTQYYSQVDAHHEIPEFEIRTNPDRGPVKYLNVIARFERDESGNVSKLVGTMHDVTDRVLTHEDLMSAKRSLERSNQFKDMLLANMSHEIRTPMNIILGYSDMIKSFMAHRLAPEELEYFDSIQSAGTRLMRTVDNVLQMSNLQVGVVRFKPEPLDAVEVVKSIVFEMQPIARQKQLHLTLETVPCPTTIIVDRYMFEQALTNIIENAIKFTVKGGITVSVHNEESQARIVIQDTGVGISEEYIPTLFDEFTQEIGGFTRPFDGLGLGLALVKRYVDMNKGRVSVQSERSQGSEFTLTFDRVT